ncbi:uncharacterized protein LOC125490609 [Plutella xylostella]|uniref:uncharacterized protein LOC125490609 n=1 Tax=Plutella xylostella TaxID=51655 RepID=UPI002032F447|nr:uncharacterized protein LOC125490609 [Plutella xylostella]
MSYGRGKNLLLHEYRAGVVPLARVSAVRDLGVQFRSDLNFREHITSICKQAFQRLGFILRRCQSFSNTVAVRTLYNALVRSKLECNAIVWSPHQDKYITMLERMQNKFTRFLYLKMYGVYPFYPLMYPTLFVLGMVGYNKLEVRRNLALVMFLTKVVRGLECNPNVLKLLKFVVPSSSLRRRKNRMFEVPLGKTALVNEAPLTRGIRLLNILADEIDILVCKMSELEKAVIYLMCYGNTK